MRVKTKGFTLIELMTVIGILGVIGTIAVSIVTITLRGTKKTDLLETAQQNSDTAMTQMVRNIRYATVLSSPTTCVPTISTSSITITSVSNQSKIIYSCNAGTITDNGVSLINTTSFNVTACSFTCMQQAASDPPIITIQFTLAPKTAGLFSETNFTLPFQTSVTMRNVQ
jgi:prepilin-type N-terminal cleavage/methylation domain-containing protein